MIHPGRATECMHPSQSEKAIKIKKCRSWVSITYYLLPITYWSDHYLLPITNYLIMYLLLNPPLSRSEKAIKIKCGSWVSITYYWPLLSAHRCTVWARLSGMSGIFMVMTSPCLSFSLNKRTWNHVFQPCCVWFFLVHSYALDCFLWISQNCTL